MSESIRGALLGGAIMALLGIAAWIVELLDNRAAVNEVQRIALRNQVEIEHIVRRLDRDLALLIHEVTRLKPTAEVHTDKRGPR